MAHLPHEAADVVVDFVEVDWSEETVGGEQEPGILHGLRHESTGRMVSGMLKLCFLRRGVVVFWYSEAMTRCDWSFHHPESVQVVAAVLEGYGGQGKRCHDRLH